MVLYYYFIYYVKIPLFKLSQEAVCSVVVGKLVWLLSLLTCIMENEALSKENLYHIFFIYSIHFIFFVFTSLTCYIQSEFETEWIIVTKKSPLPSSDWQWGLILVLLEPIQRWMCCLLHDLNSLRRDEDDVLHVRGGDGGDALPNLLVSLRAHDVRGGIYQSWGQPQAILR